MALGFGQQCSSLFLGSTDIDGRQQIHLDRPCLQWARRGMRWWSVHHWVAADNWPPMHLDGELEGLLQAQFHAMRFNNGISHLHPPLWGNAQEAEVMPSTTGLWWIGDREDNITFVRSCSLWSSKHTFLQQDHKRESACFVLNKWHTAGYRRSAIQGWHQPLNYWSVQRGPQCYHDTWWQEANLNMHHCF